MLFTTRDWSVAGLGSASMPHLLESHLSRTALLESSFRREPRLEKIASFFSKLQLGPTP